MRIGFDAKRLYCNFTGLGNYSRTLVKNLKDFYPDNEYHLYTPKVKNNPKTDHFLNNPSYHTHIHKGMFKSLWRSYGIADQLKKDNIELYHGLSHEIPINLHKTKIKSVLTIHDLIFKIYPHTYSAINRKIYDLKFKYSCIHADKIIAISNSTKNDIIKHYNIPSDKIDVIYQSCDPLFYQSDKNPESGKILKQYNIPSEYLLYVGSVEKRKNLKTLIEAYSILTPNSKIPLVVVGNGKAYKNEMMQLIAAKGLDKLFIWVDNLKDTLHLQTLYRNSMAFIYPSLYEGFGLPIAEALLSKTPVITSKFSSLPEAGGPDSAYIDPTKPEEMADAINKVLTDQGLRNTMVNKGYEYALENFTAEKVTRQVIESYKKI